MSKMGNNKLDDYFDYVAPPLEGFLELRIMNGFL